MTSISTRKYLSAEKLTNELKDLIFICQQNLFYTQKLQKWANNKRVKPQSYMSGKKKKLNSKYIKTKDNWKLKNKFFGTFQVLNSVGK